MYIDSSLAMRGKFHTTLIDLRQIFKQIRTMLLHLPVGRCARRPDPVAAAGAAIPAELFPRANLVLSSPLQRHRRCDQRAEDLMVGWTDGRLRLNRKLP